MHLFSLVSNLEEIDRKSYIKSPQHNIPSMAVEEDEKEIPQEEKLAEETIAVDEEDKNDAEEEMIVSSLNFFEIRQSCTPKSIHHI